VVQQRFAELVAEKHAEDLLRLHAKEQSFTADLYDFNLATAVKAALERKGHLVSQDRHCTKLSITRSGSLENESARNAFGASREAA
jgi:hypothetical protein